ncbi:hypothetical protein HPP92_029013 [Vanilla planifolia]|uniref:Uncharacterized protein n=1 Tax=Vanilla planifolia TaxID=51239 RepID=A0A835U1L6_VANPL|nr:hypothetical protein HPP92_029001 [Vanilla planifolia]KAG0446094.1 hypothetical protein HPP92_029013 [Vanilla planifolia]
MEPWSKPTIKFLRRSCLVPLLKSPDEADLNFIRLPPLLCQRRCIAFNASTPGLSGDTPGARIPATRCSLPRRRPFRGTRLRNVLRQRCQRVPVRDLKRRVPCPVANPVVFGRELAAGKSILGPCRHLARWRARAAELWMRSNA